MENHGFLTKLSGTFLTPDQNASFTITVYSPQLPPNEPVVFDVVIESPHVIFLESMWEQFKEILEHPIYPDVYEPWQIEIDDSYKYHPNITPTCRIIGKIKIDSYPGLESFTASDGGSFIDFLYQTILNGFSAKLTKTTS